MNILITGGSRGIGKSIVDKFTRLGHNVSAPSRQELDLHKKVVLGNVDYDIVINNAGINPIKSIENISDEDVMRVNYFSPLEIIQQCMPYMVSQKFGRIINIGSIWIDIAKPNRAAYSSSKNALHSLTKSITAEYSKFNVLCNTVSPGFIDTEMTRKNNTKEEIMRLTTNIPVGRMGNAEEVADLVYYLSVSNNFIGGQNIIIDGGYSCVAQ